MYRTLLSLTATLAALSPAWAGSLYGLTTDNRLVQFKRTDPSQVTQDLAITGLTGNDTLLGIDFRPATGELWAISTTRLYTIDPKTGAATDRTGGTPFAITGPAIGFDFNPAVDRIRVVGIDDQDLRLNPFTGGLAFVDGALTYSDGSDIRATASAYANNIPGTLTTTLYNIDAGRNGWNLTIQTPPNSGTNVLVAGITGLNLPMDASDWNVGFDIIGTQSVGYLSLQSDTASSYLYRLNLATGAAVLSGEIGVDLDLRDIAAPVPEAHPLAPLTAGVAGLVGWHLRRRRIATRTGPDTVPASAESV